MVVARVDRNDGIGKQHVALEIAAVDSKAGVCQPPKGGVRNVVETDRSYARQLCAILWNQVAPDRVNLLPPYVSLARLNFTAQLEIERPRSTKSTGSLRDHSRTCGCGQWPLRSQRRGNSIGRKRPRARATAHEHQYERGRTGEPQSWPVARLDPPTHRLLLICGHSTHRSRQVCAVVSACQALDVTTSSATLEGRRGAAPYKPPAALDKCAERVVASSGRRRGPAFAVG